MFVWVLVCLHTLRCSVERKDAACCGNQRPPPPPPSLLYLFFYSSFLPFFLACSPPLHQGRSSPGAEIQFRSSSSAFSAFTGSNAERTLSYLLPAQIERLGAGSSPCFHAILSGRYPRLEYTGGQAPHSELKIIKVVYSLGGKSKLAPPMRYIHSASAKWSLRPRHHGR